MVSLTDINARLASIQKGIFHIQTDFDKIYTYLETLAIQIMSHLLLSPYLHREILENIKRGMAKHPELSLPNDPNQDIRDYYELL